MEANPPQGIFFFTCLLVSSISSKLFKTLSKKNSIPSLSMMINPQSHKPLESCKTRHQKEAECKTNSLMNFSQGKIQCKETNLTITH